MLKPGDNQTGIEEQLGLKSDEPVEVVEPSIEAKLRYGSDFHTTILDRVKARLKLAKDAVQQRYDAWDQVDEQVRLYANLSRGAKRPDGTSLTDTVEYPFERGIVVPVSYAVLTVRLSQLMSILMNRSPLWEIQGNGPEDIKPAKIMEMVLDYDMQQSAAFLSLFTQLQDAEKYGVGILYDVWEEEHGWTYNRQNQGESTSLANAMFDLPMRPAKAWGVTKEYNSWTAIDPYRFWCDPRVPKVNFQQGEFAGHRINRSYLFLLERSQDNNGPYFNVEFLPKFQAEFRDISPKRDLILASSMDLKASTDPGDKGYFILDHLQN